MSFESEEEYLDALSDWHDGEAEYQASLEKKTISEGLHVFWCDDHKGFWPVGVASVVVAPDPASAFALLDIALREAGLPPFDEHPYTLHDLDTDRPHALIIHDGDY